MMRPAPSSRSCAIWQRSDTRAWPASAAWTASCTAARAPTRSVGQRASWRSPRASGSTDFTPESGARATRQLLSDPEPPTAIIYDSAVLGVTGLGAAQQMGFSVPDDLSIVAWDDSLICQVVHPPLTAVARDIPAYGEAAAIRLLAEIDGRGNGDVEIPRGVLTPRASTAPPAAALAARRSRRAASRAR